MKIFFKKRGKLKGSSPSLLLTRQLLLINYGDEMGVLRSVKQNSNKSTFRGGAIPQRSAAEIKGRVHIVYRPSQGSNKAVRHSQVRDKLIDSFVREQGFR